MSHRIYRITSIGRPLDPSYRTNRAVLLILPLAGLIGSAVAGARGADLIDALIAGLIGVAVAFGAWALARELAPDDDPAAFISLALAYASYLVLGPPSLFLLFTALLLTRIVNRSVGVPARPGDSIFVCALTLWTAYVTGSPLVALVGAIAFAFDAALPRPLRRQWWFVGLCLVGAVLWMVVRGYGADELTLHASGSYYWVVALITLLYAIAYFRTRRLSSVGDQSGVPLSLRRVRAGMVVGLLVPAQALMIGDAKIAWALWATLAGVGVSSLLGLAPRRERLRGQRM